MKLILITIFTLVCSPSLATQDSEKGLTFVTVGSDGCGFTTIQAAIDAGPDRIRVVQGTFNENLILFNQSIKIIGGYVNCSSAASDINLTGTTTINANNIATGFYISHNNSNNINIELFNLNFEFGKAGDSDLAGGILVNGNPQTTIKLTNVNIEFSTGSGLGLINVGSAILNDIEFMDNIDFNGGGIYSFNSHVIVYGDSKVENNTADNFGGGIYLTSGSVFSIYSTSVAQTTRGVQNNLAKKKGGGLYADGASSVFIISEEVQLGFGTVGNNSSTVSFISNRAGDNANIGDGGGVYLAGTNTVLTMNDGVIHNNFATGNGGGIAVTDNANLVVTHPPNYECSIENQCNLITANIAGENNSIGGGIFAESGASVFIGNAHFSENQADFGSAIYAINNNTQVTVEGSSFYRNLPRDDNNRSGTYVIRAFTGAKITVGFSSFKNNNANTATFGFFQADLTLAGVIIHDSLGTPVLSQSGSTVTNYCILAHDISTLSGTNLIASPSSPFVEEFTSDIHLKNDTLAIDACDNSVYNPIFKDADQELRNFDTGTPNLDGAYDIGADEFWVDEIIFKDSFDNFNEI